MSRSSVLHTRLLPPRVPAGAVPRGELAERVAAELDRGGTVTVTAGAGFGKSILLARTVAMLRCPWVFLSCDRQLDPALLLTHLVAGVEKRFPGFGADLADASQATLLQDVVNELALAVPEEIVLVLDDAHDLPERSAETVLTLAQQLPPHVTLAMAGRTALTAGPPTPGRRLLALTEADLAMTPEEAAALLRAEADLDAERIEHIYARTEGWVAGLSLAAQAASLGADPTPADREPFEYLATEVLDAERPELREFLLQTSILDRFSPQLAAAVTGRGDAAKLCRELVARHLFTARLDAEGEWYRYHALFAEVLRESLARRPAEELAELHRRAAAALMDDGKAAAGARHLIEAGDHADAARALADVADPMSQSAEAATLVDLLDRIPEEAWREDLGLSTARASALYLVGAGERARIEHERVVALAFDREDWAAATEALISLGIMQGDRGRMHETGDFFEEALGRIPTRTPQIAVLHAMAAFAFGLRDDAAVVREHIETARAMNPPPPIAKFIDAVEVSIAGRLNGDPGAPAVADEAVRALRAANVPELARPTIVALIIRGGTSNWLGHFEQALEQVREFERFVLAMGIRHTVAWALWSRLVSYVGLSRWDEAESLLASETTELARFEDSGVWSAYLRPVSAALAARRDDGDVVRESAASLRDELDRLPSPTWERGAVCTEMANACQWHAPDDARWYAAEAVTAARAASSVWIEARAQAALARVASDDTIADAALARSLELTDAHGLDAIWTRRDRRLAPDLLARAILRDIGPTGTASRLVADAGAEVFARVAELTEDAAPEARTALFEAGGRSATVAREDLPDAPVAPRPRRARGEGRPRLQLLSLGGFGLERDGERVPNASFGRARARAVLAALLAAGEPVHRDRLLEWFWPDLDAERGVRAFHVTMSAVRRAMEPDLERGAASSVIATEGDTYRVLLDDAVTFDADEFVRLVEAGADDPDPDTQRATLTAALALHGGEPFPEWAYDAWVDGLRNRVQRARARALAALGGNLIDGERGAEAVEPLSQLVELDPCSEAAHRGLMRAYDAAGERARALRQFHACRSALVREQGVEPSEETRDLYAAILGDG